MAMVSKQCYWCNKNIGNINIITNIGLFIIKLIGGVIGRSQAMVADAVHSVSDIVVALIFTAGLKVAERPADDDHQWGHGNIEFIVSCLIGIFLLFAAIAISIVSLNSIFSGVTEQPGLIAMLASVIAVITNELLFRQGCCIGKQMNSPSMVANAYAARADVYSSGAALVGVFGARLGFPVLDPLAAIVVASVIGKTGLETLIEAIQGILDKSIRGPAVDDIAGIVNREQGVRKISNMRARKVGQKIAVDMEVEFEPEATLHEVRGVIEQLKQSIFNKVNHIATLSIVPRAAVDTNSPSENAGTTKFGPERGL